MKFRYITPLVVAAGAAAAIIAAPTATAADTGDQSCSAAPGVIDSVCVTPEMLRSTTPHRFSSVRSIPTGRAAGVWLRPQRRRLHTADNRQLRHCLTLELLMHFANQ
jgi:hypothetical protein